MGSHRVTFHPTQVNAHCQARQVDIRLTKQAKKSTPEEWKAD